MQDRMGFLWVALLTMAVPATASAQHVWFSPKIGEFGGYGLKIASDTWPDSSLEYTDKTYQFFKAYQISKNNKMGAYDYSLSPKAEYSDQLYGNRRGLQGVAFFAVSTHESFWNWQGGTYFSQLYC